MSSPFPWSPMICGWLRKKNQTENKNTLKVDIHDNNFSGIHWIGQKYQGNEGKKCQLVIVKFKGFIPRTKVYTAAYIHLHIYI